MKSAFGAALVTTALLATLSAGADTISGHVTRMKFTGLRLSVQLDTGLPASCTAIGATSLDLTDQFAIEFLTKLWVSGQAPTVPLNFESTVISAAPPGQPSCSATSIDTGAQ
jgi:hypothetical protein